MRQVLVVVTAVLVLVGAANWAVAAKKKKAAAEKQMPAVAVMVLQAKTLMAQGNRKLAIELLDRAAATSKSKTERRELLARRTLFLEQFLTSESFQNFEAARSFSTLDRWDECLHELDAIGEKDKDNVLGMRLRADCQRSLKQLAAAETTLKSVLALIPNDMQASFELAELAVTTRQTAPGLALLESIEPTLSADVERYVILKAKLLEQADKIDEAAELLREDQETRLEHVGVIYELGVLYMRMPGRDWPARKMLSLFVTRCKRMKETELKSRHLDLLLPLAQTALTALDKKLGV